MSNTSFVPGGQPIPSESRVATDQATVFGDGTSGNPLRATGSSGSLTRSTPGTFPAGSAVRISNFDGTHAVLAEANAISSASVVGVLTEDSEATIDAKYRSVGTVTLTEAQWDAIAGTSGGLDPGVPYYLSDTTPGMLLPRAAIVTSGHFWTQVGIALSATELQLQLSAPIPVP